jgi:hypothetical protein
MVAVAVLIENAAALVAPREGAVEGIGRLESQRSCHAPILHAPVSSSSLDIRERDRNLFRLEDGGGP